MKFDDLKAFAPGAKATILFGLVDAWHCAEAAGINTPARVCHFLAQLATESDGFRKVEEDLSYSAKRLCEVWPKRFPTLASAQPFAKNPRALANKVYGGRMGNVGPDDGWRYRGRGPKQLTGKDNYAACGRDLGIDLVNDPDRALEPAVGFRIAVWFWSKNGLNRDADKNDIRSITFKINGGYIGLADRRAWFRKAVAIWGEDEVNEIGKPVMASRTVKASLMGGGLSLAGIADAAYQASSAIENGRSISEVLGVSMLTLVLFAAVLGLIGYIVWDRWFIARYEGL